MKNKLKSIFQKTGVVRLLKSLRLRIFLIVCLVGIIPILLMKMNILERYEDCLLYTSPSPRDTR